MRVEITSGNVVLSNDVADEKGAFEFIAGVNNVFQYSRCGCCDGPAIPDVRDAKGYRFYAMRCVDCGAQLKFGQRKEDGGLFPKLKDAEGHWLNKGGWQKDDYTSIPGEHKQITEEELASYQ